MEKTKRKTWKFRFSTISMHYILIEEKKSPFEKIFEVIHVHGLK